MQIDGGERRADEGMSIAVGEDGAMFVSGSLLGGPWLAKLDTDGEALWDRIEPSSTPMYDTWTSLVLAEEKTIVATGTTYSAETRFDVVVAVFDETGAENWRRTSDGPGGAFDAGADIAVGPEGDVYVAGAIAQPSATDAWIAKYDRDGRMMWSYREGASGWSFASSIDVGADGRTYVTGWLQDRIGGPGTMWILELDPDGNEVRTLPEEPIEGAGVAIAAFPGGGFVVAGVVSQDVWIRRYDADGESMWTRTRGEGRHGDEPRAVVVDETGNVYVGGYVEYGLRSGARAKGWVASYDADGEPRWDVATPAPARGGDEQVNGLAIHPDGRIATIGSTFVGQAPTGGLNTDVIIRLLCP